MSKTVRRVVLPSRSKLSPGVGLGGNDRLSYAEINHAMRMKSTLSTKKDDKTGGLDIGELGELELG